MASEIERAIVAMNRRKESILEGATGKSTDAVVGDDQMISMFSGFDLDPAEIIEFGELAGAQGARAALVSGDVIAAFSSLFLDGLAAGLMIAEARQKAAAR